MYSQKEIDSNSSLYNLTQCRSFAESYIKERIGDDFSQMVFEKSGTAEAVTYDGEFIIDYDFYYSSWITNLGVYDNQAGDIIISVAPNGTILSFMYFNPGLKSIGSVEPINATKAINTVDGNFDSYRKYLLAGYDSFTLIDMELVYGLSDDTLRIGWELSFIVDNDDTKVSSVFIS
jgi:hypothetical protein